MADTFLPAELRVRTRLSVGAFLLGGLLLFTLAFAAAYALLDPWTLDELLRPALDGLVVVVVLLAAALVTLIAVLLARSRSVQRDNSEGLRLLSLGKAAEAEALFLALERKNRWIWSLRIPARWNVAMSQLLQGHFDDTLRRCALLGGEPYCKRGVPHVWEGLPSVVALCYALRGRLDEADAALAEQQRRRVQRHLMSWVLPQAVIACRRGRVAEALPLFEAEPRALEAAYAGVLGRALRLVHAYALTEVGRPLPAGLRAAIGFVDEADIAWALEWPELDRWVRDSGLPGVRAA